VARSVNSVIAVIIVVVVAVIVVATAAAVMVLKTRKHETQQVSSRGNATDMYLGCTKIESRPGHQLS
jgi:flagellar basal body-associated protein FliL